MTKELELNDYTYKSDIEDTLVNKSSLLNDFTFTEELTFDQSYEGVSGRNILFDGMQIKKKKYADDTAGIWMGVDSDRVAKMYLGDSSNSVTWDGTTLNIKGDLTAGSININDKAIIDSDGDASFVGLSSLNMKAMTTFETTGRFLTTTGGTGAANFGNQGCQLSTGATATSYVKTLWNATSAVLNNEPTFTCTARVDTVGTLTGRCVIGLGDITLNGSGVTEADGKSFAGFYIRKDGGVVTLGAYQQDDNSDYDYQGSLVTLTTSDVVELFMKVKSTGIDYYWRKNGGALSSVTTLTDGNPAGNVETYIFFGNTNWGTASDYDIMLTCAAYEH